MHKLAAIGVIALTGFTFGATVLPLAIEREMHRQVVACHVDQARGYPVRCTP